MENFYEELGLDRSKRIDEINTELSKLESTWKRREITNPEKATTMLALIIRARKAFSSDAARRSYDNELADSLKKPEQVDPDKERSESLKKWREQASSYYATGQYDLAKVAVEKAISLSNVNGDDDSLFALAADIYKENGDLQTAMSYINRAIVAAPDVSAYYLSKGLICDQQASAAFQRGGYGNPVNFRAEARKMFQMADAKAEQSGDLANRAHACGALAFSFYFQDPIDKQKGEHFAELAVKFGGDSWGNADKVLSEAKRIHDEQEEARKKKIYDEAVSDAKSEDVVVLEKAIKQFESLNGWKDSDRQIEMCKNKISSIKEKKKKEEEEKKKIRERELAEEERRKKEQEEKRLRTKRIVKASIIITVPIVVIILVVSAISSSIAKKKEIDAAQIAAAISEAQVFADDYDYEGALEVIENAMKTYRSSDDLATKKTEYTEALNAQKAVQAQIDAIIYQAQELADKEDYEGALEVIKAGMDTYADSKQLKDKADEFDEIIFTQNKAKVLSSAEELANNGDYISAINLIKDIQGERKNDQDCNAAINLYTEKYVNETVSEVDTFINEGYFATAKSTLDSAMAALPGNEVLTEKNETLSELLRDSKMMLTELTSVADKPRSSERLTDNYGNSYSSAIINNHGYSGSSGPIDYEYLLGGKYRTLSGVIYVPEGEKSGDSSFLTIISDGIIVYSSPEMTKTSAPEEFIISITGCNDLIIEWSNNAGYNNISSLNCCIADLSVDMSADSLSEVTIADDTKLSPGAVMMKNMTSVATDPRNTVRLIDIDGNRYGYAVINNHGYSGSAGPIDYEYLLNGKYNRFKGVLYVPKDENSNGISSLTIILDGVTAYVSPDINKSTSAITIDLDISGCNDMVIEWSNNAGYNNISSLNCCLGDAYFIP